MGYIIKLPFGNGYAILSVDYTEGEDEYFNHKEGFGNPTEGDEIEITKFVVGGVDIYDELCEILTKKGLYDTHYLDKFIDKNYGEIIKQIYHQDE